MLPGRVEIAKSLANISNILDKELVGYQCGVGAFGDDVEYICGGYCVTVPMKKSSDNKYSKCLRIWYNDLPDMKKRSALVSKALRLSKLPYFLDYEYLEQAVKVNGNFLAGIRMDWEDEPTVTLRDFLRNGATADQLKKLYRNFFRMCYDMKRCGFAHGDLSSGNILVKPDTSILLVDYDSMYVPGMHYNQQIEGTEGYQHPRRKNEILKAGPNNDNFSQIIIYVQLLAFAKQPILCKQIDDNALLFNGNDLASSKVFRSSSPYKTLYALKDNDIIFYLDEVAKAIDQPLDEVKSLCDLTPPSAYKPEPPKPVETRYRIEPIYIEPAKPNGSERPKPSPSPMDIPGEYCAYCQYKIAEYCKTHKVVDSSVKFCPNCGKERKTYRL